MDKLDRKASKNLKTIREKKPLIHNITNFVVMNVTANGLLALGASPVMAHAQDEVEQMASMAGAIVLNIGTLSNEWIVSMIKAGKKARDLKIPVVLDPVGAGATTFRTKTAKKIIQQVKPTVIRGNPSEILSLRDKTARTKGVDAIHSVAQAEEAGMALALELKTTLAITGPTDLVTDGNRVVRIENGHGLMSSITGSGCMATTMIAAFLSVDTDPVTAAASALAFFGLAGEIAARTANGPGTFMANLLDALYAISPDVLRKGARFREGRGGSGEPNK